MADEKTRPGARPGELARALGRAVGDLVDGLVTAALPPACAACRALGREPFCPTCAEALVAAPPFAVEDADRALAAWLYGGPVAEAITRLKFDGLPELARPLGLALVPLLAEVGPADVVVPVPLTKRRLAERGFNQARELARGLPLPVFTEALVRTDAAHEQVGLGREARLANLRHGFQPGPEPVRGLRVVLVDDVVTTGATASAAARALRAAGAATISVVALARAELTHDRPT